MGQITERAWEWLEDEEYDTEYLEDDDEVRRLYIDLGPSSAACDMDASP